MPVPFPRLLVADAAGKIYDDPELLMLCRRGREWALPRPGELMPLPPESTLFLLPGRHAVGLDPASGESVTREEWAVAAFVAPAHTLTGHPVYASLPSAPALPLFAYGAVGMVGDRFYVCARKVDEDKRQVFAGISDRSVRKAARALVARFPRNRLVRHLMDNCVLRYACPAARNLCLGRYEAPLPVSRSCNARCVGCISRRDDSAPFRATPQDRLTFTPSVDELVEVMLHHQSNETNAPLYSFGQGCEGEPLTEADLLVETVRVFRAKGGKGTVNLNSNASLPRAVARLAGAGLTSLRVTLNSARPAAYDRYHRPGNYCFGDVRQSIREARSAGVFVSLNLLYFPGITDGEEELEALGELIGACDVQYVQLRNLNIDPELYLRMQEDLPSGPAVGLVNFCRRLKKIRPGLTFGYFNPAVARTDEGERG